MVAEGGVACVPIEKPKHKKEDPFEKSKSKKGKGDL
jgi:hypothetical protein